MIDALVAGRYSGLYFSSSFAGQALIDAMAQKGQSIIMTQVMPRPNAMALTVVNLLGEYPFGRWHVFANAENLTDVRQTHWDPIARSSPDLDGRWTVDAWAPLWGRVVNIGIKVSF